MEDSIDPVTPWWNTSARPEVTELAQKSQIEVWDTSDDLRESWGARSAESLKGLHGHVGPQVATAFLPVRKGPKDQNLTNFDSIWKSSFPF